MKPVDAIVAGHICLDIIPSFLDSEVELSSLFEPGHLSEVGKATLSTGGVVSNTGLALHKLGTKARLLGKVGDDLWGRAILEILGSYGEDLPSGMVVTPGENTSYTIVVNVPGYDRIFLHAPGTNDTFCSDDIPLSELPNARLFHFGYPPLMAQMYANDGSELIRIFKEAKAAGLITSLDMAMPDPFTPAGKADWPAILADLLPYVDFFIPSVEEMLLLLGWAVDEPVLADEMIEMGAKVVGLKAGKQGLYLRSAAETPFGPAWSSRELWAPCFKVNVVGTTGAGDATVAGCLQGILEGLGPEATMELGNATGAYCVEAADAISSIPGRLNIEERIANGWPRQSLSGKLAGWRPVSHGVWQSPRDKFFTS